MTSEMFELNKTITEKQSDKFNVYKDSVEDIMSEKTYIRLEITRLQNSINNMQDKNKKDKDKEKDNDKNKNTEFKSECRDNDKYSEKYSSNSNFNTNRNKDKDKNVKNTGAASVHNVMKQVFCIKEKVYMSDQTGKDI
ncbi:uncharacterized protein BDCG_16595 [Blastomyces dermatitidis ER-3]|uniref:Uncharacterized protein n=1 Tax=Ajellomyces dermatitidis (strain ER-3 / ATCC MYA-2586) TaxID=559297 RepID=A0ABX2VT08_AJEDR|nr:uncharacterized protein BDCG_16595 [Blastomyces dermatitidis ER-3]OAT00340.1 hypothetical protein BDCG_16595 [Blastomyces dermatitidis ER-3]